MKYKYNTDPSSITKFLIFMLFLTICISLVSIISDIIQLNVIDRSFISNDIINSNDFRQKIIGYMYFCIYIVTGITFLRWIYISNDNCHGFKALGMEFTPGWSIGYYFIPGYNIYKPYKSMREIFNVSSNPNDWKEKNGGFCLKAWWTLYIFSAIISQISFRSAIKVKDIKSLITSTSLSIFSTSIEIPLCIISIILVVIIYKKQEKLVNSTFINESEHTVTALQKDVNWFYADENIQKGPFTYDLIKKYVDEHIIKNSTLVWSENMTNWVEADKTVFASLFIVSPPPLPIEKNIPPKIPSQKTLPSLSSQNINQIQTKSNAVPAIKSNIVENIRGENCFELRTIPTHLKVALDEQFIDGQIGRAHV